MSHADGPEMFDVFVSYSHKDKAWVRGWLLQRLEAVGVKVCIDYRNFELGERTQRNIEQAIENSRATLLVLTPDYMQSEWGQLEAAMASVNDPLNLDKSVFMLLLKQFAIPTRFSVFTYADLTDAENRAIQLGRLVQAILSLRRQHKNVNRPRVRG